MHWTTYLDLNWMHVDRSSTCPFVIFLIWRDRAAMRFTNVPMRFVLQLLLQSAWRERFAPWSKRIETKRLVILSRSVRVSRTPWTILKKGRYTASSTSELR